MRVSITFNDSAKSKVDFGQQYQYLFVNTNEVWFQTFHPVKPKELQEYTFQCEDRLHLGKEIQKRNIFSSYFTVEWKIQLKCLADIKMHKHRCKHAW